MPRRSSKNREDVNRLAAAIVESAAASAEGQPQTSDTIGTTSSYVIPSALPSDKNPAAVALGRLGGQKGGVARAKRLSKQRRSEIARQAAVSRWTKRQHG